MPGPIQRWRPRPQRLGASSAQEQGKPGVNPAVLRPAHGSHAPREACPTRRPQHPQRRHQLITWMSQHPGAGVGHPAKPCAAFPHKRGLELAQRPGHPGPAAVTHLPRRMGHSQHAWISPPSHNESAKFILVEEDTNKKDLTHPPPESSRTPERPAGGRAPKSSPFFSFRRRAEAAASCVSVHERRLPGLTPCIMDALKSSCAEWNLHYSWLCL